MKQLLRRACAWSLLLAAMAGAPAASAGTGDEAFELSAANLLVVLRETPGANKQDEDLLPFGKIGARLPDGRDIEFEASWFQYLGDMHLRWSSTADAACKAPSRTTWRSCGSRRRKRSRGPWTTCGAATATPWRNPGAAA